MKILQPSGSGGIVFIVVLSLDKRKYFLYSTKTHIFFLYASVAQSAERNHGKVEVSGSIPLGG